MAEVITPKSKEHWLKLRSTDITSTDVSALTGHNPYKSKFQLYKEKTTREDYFTETDYVRWGKRLEQAIGFGVAEDQGWSVAPMPEYLRHDSCYHAGSSFDFKILGNTPGILEIKNVDYFAWRRNWTEELAPAHIEIQLQFQLEVSGYAYGYICAFVGGNTVHLYRRDRDQKTGRALIRHVNDFWSDVHKNIEPEINFEADAEFLAQLYRNANGDHADMTAHNRLAEVCAQYDDARAREKAALKDKAALKGEVFSIIGNSPTVEARGYNINAKSVSKDAYDVPAKTYRQLRITKQENYDG